MKRGCTGHFYPRSRKGSDFKGLILLPPQNDFYPRSRKGSDMVTVLNYHVFQYFYPRSRKGSDIPATVFYLDEWHFYPRSRKGSDYYPPCKFGYYYISIHAPARGATRNTCGNWKANSRFLSTLPQGERRITRRITTRPLNFYPRSRKGSDPCRAEKAGQW